MLLGFAIYGFLIIGSLDLGGDTRGSVANDFLGVRAQVDREVEEWDTLMVERGCDTDDESDMAGDEVLSLWLVCARGRVGKRRGRDLGLIEGELGVVVLFVL